jgi:hypothetical protein
LVAFPAALAVVSIVFLGTPVATARAVFERLDLAVNDERGFAVLGVPDCVIEPVVLESVLSGRSLGVLDLLRTY